MVKIVQLLSAETKLKMSNAAKGHIVSIATKLKISKTTTEWWRLKKLQSAK